MKSPAADRVRQFFSNPVVGILGSVASIVSLGLAIALYFAAQEHRDLVHTVHPVRTTLVQGVNPSGLTVEFRGERITGVDVLAIQIAIWNQGKAAIREANILSPLEIRLPSTARVLDAKITKASREVVRFDVHASNEEHRKQGRVPLRFHILERGDGAIVQVIYAGPSDLQPEMAGVIEGAGPPRHLASRAAAPPEVRYKKDLKLRTVFLFVAPLPAILSLVLWAMTRFASIEVGPGPKMQNLAVALFTASVAVWVAVFFLFDPIPPFGF